MIPNIKEFAEYIIAIEDEKAWIFGVALANVTGLPMIIDRGYVKKHGTQRRYEGVKDINKIKGKRVVEIRIIESWQPEISNQNGDDI